MVNAQEIRRLEVTVSADVGQAVGGLRAVDAASDDTAESLRRADQSAGSLASRADALQGALMGVAGVAAGASYALFQIAQTGAQVDTTFATIQATASATDAEMETIRQTALRLGEDLPVSLRDAANAFREMSFAGLSAKESVQAAGAVAELASSSTMSIADSSRVVTSALNQFGLQADQAASVANGMAATFASSALTMEELAGAFDYAGAAASTAGQSLTEVNAALGTLADRGMRGTRAGTGLQQMFTQIASPSESAKEALQQVGLAVDDFLDHEGNFKNLSDIVQLLSERMSGLPEGEQLQVLTDVFGQRGARAVAPLIQNVDSLQTKLQQVANADIASSIDSLSELSQEDLQARTDSVAFELTPKMDREDVLSQLQDLSSEMTQEELATQIQVGLNVDQRAAELLAGRIAGGESIDSLAQSLEDATTAGELAEAQMQTLAGQTEALLGSIESMAYSMYQGALPGLKALVGGLSTFVGAIRGVPGLTQALGAGLFAVASAATVATVGLGAMYAELKIGAMLQMASNMRAAATSTRVFAAASWAASSAGGALNAAMGLLTGQYARTAAAAVASAAGNFTLAGAMGTVAGAFSTAAVAAYGFLAALGPIGWIAIAAGALLVGSALTDLGGTIDWLLSPFTFLIDLLGGLVNWTGELVGSILNLAGAIGGLAIDALILPFQLFYDVVNALTGGILSDAAGGMQAMGEGALSFLSPLIELPQTINSVADAIRDFDAREFLNDLPGHVIDVVADLPGIILGAIPTIHWGDFIPDIDLGAFIDGLSWTAFIPPLAIAEWVTGVSLGDFVEGIEWTDFILPLRIAEWITGVSLGEHVEGVDLVDFVTGFAWDALLAPLRIAEWVTGIDLADFIADFNWLSIIPALGWGDHVPEVSISAFIEAFSWDEVVSSFSWDGVIPEVDLANLIQAFDWMDVIPSFEWTGILPDVALSDVIQAFDWADVIPPFEWTGILPDVSIADVVQALDWADVIPPFEWSGVLSEVSVSDFIQAFDWMDVIPPFEWSGVLPDMSIEDVIQAFDWADVIPEFEWTGVLPDVSIADFIQALDWADVIPEFSWGDWIPNVDLGSFITPPSGNLFGDLNTSVPDVDGGDFSGVLAGLGGGAPARMRATRENAQAASQKVDALKSNIEAMENAGAPPEALETAESLLASTRQELEDLEAQTAATDASFSRLSRYAKETIFEFGSDALQAGVQFREDPEETTRGWITSAQTAAEDAVDVSARFIDDPEAETLSWLESAQATAQDYEIEYNFGLPEEDMGSFEADDPFGAFSFENPFEGMEMPDFSGVFEGISIPEFENPFEEIDFSGIENPFAEFTMPDLQNPFEGMEIPTLSGAFDGLDSLLGDAQSEVAGFAAGLEGEAEGIRGTMSDVFSMFEDRFPRTADALRTRADDLAGTIENLRSFFGDLGVALEDSADAAAQWVEQQGANLNQLVNDAEQFALDSLESAWSDAEDAADRATSAFDEFIGQPIAQKTDEVVSGFDRFINKDIPSAVSSVAGAFDEFIGTPIANTVDEATRAFDEFIGTPIAGAVEDATSAFDDLIGTPIANFFEGIQSGAEDVYNSIVNFDLGGAVSEMVSGLGNVAGMIGDQMVTGLDVAMATLLTPEEMVPKVSAWWRDAGAGFIDALADGIGSAADGIVDATIGALEGVLSFLPGSDAERGPLSNLTERGRGMIQAIASGIASSPVGMLQSAVSGLFESLNVPDLPTPELPDLPELDLFSGISASLPDMPDLSGLMPELPDMENPANPDMGALTAALVEPLSALPGSDMIAETLGLDVSMPEGGNPLEGIGGLPTPEANVTAEPTVMPEVTPPPITVGQGGGPSAAEIGREVARHGGREGNVSVNVTNDNKIETSANPADVQQALRETGHGIDDIEEIIGNVFRFNRAGVKPGRTS